MSQTLVRPSVGATVQVHDLRGTDRPPVPAPVLHDPSGLRARRLRAVSRVVMGVLLTWLAGLSLAAVGLMPARMIPLGYLVSAPAPPELLTFAGVEGAAEGRPGASSVFGTTLAVAAAVAENGFDGLPADRLRQLAEPGGAVVGRPGSGTADPKGHASPLPAGPARAGQSDPAAASVPSVSAPGSVDRAPGHMPPAAEADVRPPSDAAAEGSGGGKGQPGAAAPASGNSARPGVGGGNGNGNPPARPEQGNNTPGSSGSANGHGAANMPQPGANAGSAADRGDAAGSPSSPGNSAGNSSPAPSSQGNGPSSGGGAKGGSGGSAPSAAGGNGAEGQSRGHAAALQ